ncbi:MAG: hypothetical protein ACLUBG_01605 [Streptococcus agalactiae]
MKEFKSLTDQLNLLKDRGLKIGDEEKAELYLLTNNYYNIINGYGNSFALKKINTMMMQHLKKATVIFF